MTSDVSMRVRAWPFLLGMLLFLVSLLVLHWTNSGDTGGHQGTRHLEEEAVEPTLQGQRASPQSSDAAARAPERVNVEDHLFPAPSPERVKELLRELQDPSQAPDLSSLPPFGDNALMVGRSFFYRAHRAVEVLADVAPSAQLDAELVAIARTHLAWDSRCRAMLTLALRGYEGVSELLLASVLSPEARERYVAWDICRKAVWRGGLPPPVPAAVAVEQYVREGDAEIVEEIEGYLGLIGATEAATLLMRKIQDGPAWKTTSAAYALARMKWREAVPLLIASSDNINGSSYLHALGLIGTPEAVEHLLANINRYGAADGLVSAGDRSVVPALERVLANMRSKAEEERDRFDEREVLLAIIQLKYEDPCPALIDLVESHPDLEVRTSAAACLKSHLKAADLAHATRLARVYAKENEESVREQCLAVLRDSRAPGVTEAMLRHARVWKPHFKTTSPSHVLWQINRRLGTDFESKEDVVRYVAERGAK